MSNEEKKAGTHTKMPVVTGERLNQIVVTSVRKLFEEDSRHFIDGYLKHISSKEKVAV
jgi:hypothetical protein